MSKPEQEIKIDKSAFSITSLTDETEDRAYWLSKTPEERLKAIEINRQIIYGNIYTSSRFQRVLEIIKPT
jgi:hypothetical protein